ncbi:precorrin-6A reductase [Anaerovorax sp. IOR16]|uniref:precorrin-6A reductase n=1 Tax=Anaerovorax sp. IOR16 TaxID=2773458 RepID=UPI0019D30610|nr:precorrin-6A reductase [Anaerovorax sp. IOR16]
MPKLLIFAGTTEGRHLVEILSKNKELQVFASVATEYGKALLPDGIPNVTIKSGRMLPEEMEGFLKKECFDLVIDTTHPYAVIVTKNIKEACEKTNTTYVRLLRESTNLIKENSNQIENSESQLKDQTKLIYVENTIKAAEYLDKTEGSVLLTTGSKELEAFTKIKDYKERLYPRVLPTPEVLQKCFDLGYEGKRLICMQGPFSYEMNCALLKKTKASYMVTKDSGKVGGFDEKYQAAMDMGVPIILIGRKIEEQGLSLQEVLMLIKRTFNLEFEIEIPVVKISEKEVPKKVTLEKEKMNGWFPLFMNLAGKTVTVIGGGAIAKRRVKTLAAFSCNITVIAKEADSFFLEMQKENRLNLIMKEFEPEDIKDAMLVIAATNDRSTNHNIAEICKQRHILINVVDCKEECDFYFPGIVQKGDLTIGITAGGKDHGLAKSATAALKMYLENWDRSSAKLEENENGTKKN